MYQSIRLVHIKKGCEMKTIDNDLTAFSIKSIIVKNQTNSNGSFSSFLNENTQKEKEEKSFKETLVQEQILHKEAYLNKMMLQSLAS